MFSQGPRQGRSFVFDRHDTFIVGRSRFVHCPMPEDSALSRDHFLIEINPPRCELRDLGSTNGTFVNERRVERARLELGRPDRGRAERLPGPGRGGVDARRRGRRSPTGSRTVSVAGRPTACRSPAPAAASPAPPDVDVAERLGRGGAASRSSGSASSAAAEVADDCPQPVPHYTTLRELGRGAMGVVYQARHNQTGRMVALKLIVPEIGRRAVGHRPLPARDVGHQPVEASEHRRVARAGDDPRPVLVRDGVRRGHEPGGPGQRRARGGTRSARPAGWPARSSRGSSTPTRLGFVHRDIKPENILIGRPARGPGGQDLRLRPGQELPRARACRA